MQCANHHVVFLGVHVLDGFFQVAHAAMNDFGGRARSSTREIGGVEQYRAESAKLGIECATGARSSPADHAKIERLSRDVL